MTAAPSRRRRPSGTAVKLVVTGPFAAGKTTLIRSISEITVLSTEQDVSDDTRVQKAETTVAMDFGRITLERDLVLYLFGTPGQQRFDFMWEVLGEGMLGYVLVVDGARPETFPEAAGILGAFRALSRAPCVVAVNRLDEVDAATAAAVRAAVGAGPEIPVVPCDARDRESVKTVLLALLYAVADTLDAETLDPAPVEV